MCLTGSDAQLDTFRSWKLVGYKDNKYPPLLPPSIIAMTPFQLQHVSIVMLNLVHLSALCTL